MIKMRGFTLLELIVTIGMISILVVMGVPAFSAYERHNSSRVAAQDIKNMFVDAQSLSQNTRIEDRGGDYYYLDIYFSGVDQNEIKLGNGNFTDTGERGRETEIKEVDHGREVKIKEVLTIIQNAEKISFIFIAPSAKMLFNGLEPYPGFGYSKKCEITPNNCAYKMPDDRLALIQIGPT